MNIKDLKDCIDQSPVCGNKDYGKEFDDMEQCAEKTLPFPRRIAVRTGSVIDRLEFGYDGFALGHGGKGGAPQEFSLKQGEHIVKVEGACCDFGGKVTVRALKFTTDKGNVIQVGTEGGENFEFKAKDGYAICAMYGRADNYVRGIGFYARKVDMDLGGAFKGIGGKLPGLK